MESAARDKRGKSQLLDRPQYPHAAFSTPHRPSRVKINSRHSYPAGCDPLQGVFPNDIMRGLKFGLQGVIMKFIFGGRLILAAAIVVFALGLKPAQADVVVQIDKSSQRMAVSVD